MTTELTYPNPTGDPDDRGEPIRPAVRVSDKHVFVEPGENVRATVTVRNVSGIIETYDLAPLGPALPWTTVLPPSISLFPGEEDSATITLRPPMSSAVVAGDYVLGIRAQSQVDPACSAAEEMLVSVQPFYRFETDVSRTTFQVRTKATAQIKIANKGNSTMTYSVSAVDPENYVRIVIKDKLITLAPGESVWVPITLKVAPRPFGTTNDTLPVTTTIVPLRDEDTGIPIVDPEPENQVINLLHRPFIRLRVGIFGKLVLLIGVLALIAAFVLSRILDATPPPATGAPPTPSAFKGQLNDQNLPVLTWDPAPGATGYSIYALGNAGNPVPTPTPTIAVEVPQATTAPAGYTSDDVRITFAVAPLPRASTGPSVAAPSPSPTQNLVLEETLPSPVCIGCTEIGTVDGGTTRFVVEQVNPGENCYRISANVGEIKSLYSPPTCVTVPTAEEAAAAAAAAGGDTAGAGTDGAGGGAGAGGAGGAGAPAGPPPPCEPVLTEARVVSPTSLAILWQPATEPPKGWTAPDPSATATPAADGKMRGGDTAAKGGSDGTAADAKVCDPAAKITGWSIQRKIFTGWSDVTPEPKPNDTAIEVADLEPDTKYCFRMAAKSANGDSRYTKKFCAKTPPAAEASPSPSAPPAPSASQPVQDAPA